MILLIEEYFLNNSIIIKQSLMNVNNDSCFNKKKTIMTKKFEFKY